MLIVLGGKGWVRNNYYLHLTDKKLAPSEVGEKASFLPDNWGLTEFLTCLHFSIQCNIQSKNISKTSHSTTRIAKPS